MEKEFEASSFIRAMIKQKMRSQEGMPSKARLAVRSSLSALAMARIKHS